MAENKPAFYLKEPNSTKATPINFVMTVVNKDTPIKRSIGKNVLPPLWSLKDQRVDAGKDPELQKINRRIEDIIEGIDGIKSDCKRNNRIMSAEEVERLLDVILQKQGKKRGHTGGNMQEDFVTLIESMRAGEIMTPGKNPKRFEESTMKNYDKLMRWLFGDADFPGFYKSTNIRPSYQAINVRLYGEFIKWAHKLNYADNSIGVVVKCWKKLLKLAHKEKWHNNAFYEDNAFVKPEEAAEDIYLDSDMLNKLSLVELKGNEEVARDWALLDCHLGLRISDLKRISEDDFAEGIFQFVNKKTGAKVAIPVHPVARRIIKRWGGLPPAMYEQDLNNIIKKVAKKAGLKKRFLHKITKGGVVLKTWMEYWEMISAHTFRRTFITNLLKLGVPPLKVMKMAGIKDYETLKTYDKESVEENAEDMKNHAFFASPAALRKNLQKEIKKIVEAAFTAGMTKEQLLEAFQKELR